MPFKPLVPFAVVAFAFCFLTPQKTRAQGSLTPPGPPGPTMKTLGQIEPRTPISSLPYKISAPGAYYLTTNLQGAANSDGITIETDNVHLDLNGFTLRGTPQSRHAVTISGQRRQLSVRNGTLSAWTTGIDAANASLSTFSSLTVADNSAAGLKTGDSCLIQHSFASNNGAEGFSAQNGSSFVHCVSVGNKLAGFQSQGTLSISSSTAQLNGGPGITAGPSSQITHSIASENAGAGFVAGPDSLLQHCSARSNTGAGIEIGDGAILKSCFSQGNTLNGILAKNAANIIECQLSANNGNGLLGGDDCIVSGTIAINNLLSGLNLGNGARLEGNTASKNKNRGISCGEDASILRCVASNNTDAGIFADHSSHVIDCQTIANARGIHVESGSTVRGCLSHKNAVDGILVTSECRVLNNTCNNNFSARDSSGIHATGSDNCIQENNVVSNDRGIAVDSPGNLIIKNTASNNTLNFFINGDQTMAPIFSGPITADGTDPWVNFQF